jgi:hypothetical protein
MLFLKHISRIVLFYFIGLSIFFISGFVVFKVLFADTEKVIVPDVVGRLYLNDHNMLRDDFKVELKPAYLVQYPYGYILAQNLTPGRKVEKNTKLELLVNLSDAIVQVPKLTGFSENLVDGSLASLPVGGRIFSLRKGVITRIPSAQPKNEVLAQYPPAGTPVVPNTPVSLLVSDGPAQPGSPQASVAPKLEKGIPVSIALGAAYHLKKPASITLRKTDRAEENATLLSEAKIADDSIALEVGQFVENLTSGKSVIDLEDLPFTQLFVQAKKIGDQNQVLTVARREAVANEDGSPYSEFWLIRNSSPLPVFRRRDDSFDIFRDYYTPESSAKPAAQKADTSQTKTIVGETQAPVATTPVAQKPEKTLRLRAASL